MMSIRQHENTLANLGFNTWTPLFHSSFMAFLCFVPFFLTHTGLLDNNFKVYEPAEWKSSLCCGTVMCIGKKKKKEKIEKRKDHKMERKKVSWGQKLSALAGVKNIWCIIIWCKKKKRNCKAQCNNKQYSLIMGTIFFSRMQCTVRIYTVVTSTAGEKTQNIYL